jgi:hypothetical protein
MKIKRAFFFGACNFFSFAILGLVISLILSGFTGIENALAFSKSLLFEVASIIVMTITTVLFTFIYLRSKELKRKIIEGFYFGLALVIIDILLNLTTFLVVYTQFDNPASLLPNVFNVGFLIRYIFFLGVSTAVGFFVGKRDKRKKKK